MYPDAASRATFYNGGKQNGYLNSDDIRELEGLNPIEGNAGRCTAASADVRSSTDSPNPNNAAPDRR